MEAATLSPTAVDLEKQYLLQNYARYPVVLQRGKGCYLYDTAGKRYLDLLAGIGVNSLVSGSGGTDIGPLTEDGIPSLGLFTTGEHYFEWHHSHADTLDKIDPQDFRRCIASLAVMAFVLADMPGELTN